MTEHGHTFDPESDDAHTIEKNELGESFIGYHGEEGIYFDHNWTEGALFVEYETLRKMLTESNEDF